jgi:hypothetical protein
VASVVAVRVARGLLMGGTLMFVRACLRLGVGVGGCVGALLGPERTRDPNEGWGCCLGAILVLVFIPVHSVLWGGCWWCCGDRGSCVV